MRRRSKRETAAELRNSDRRQRYATDAEYRDSIRAKARDSARIRTHGTADTPNEAHENLRSIADFGTVRVVKGIQRMTFTVAEVARVLGKGEAMFKRWIKNEQVPPPTHLTRDGAVYRTDEVRRMVEVLARHFDQFKYYRADHEATRSALWSSSGT